MEEARSLNVVCGDQDDAIGPAYKQIDAIENTVRIGEAVAFRKAIAFAECLQPVSGTEHAGLAKNHFGAAGKQAPVSKAILVREKNRSPRHAKHFANHLSWLVSVVENAALKHRINTSVGKR